MKIKAVIFDIGGVVVGSPLEGIAAYELEHGIPHNYVNVIIVHYGQAGAFQRLERGELALPEFYVQFEKELTDPANFELYEQYLQLRGRPSVARPTAPLRINASELFRRMMQAATTPHACMLEAIARLRELGFKVAALTNNFQVPEDDESLAKVGGAASTMLPQIFDDFVESSVVGMRKPDPRVFQLALDRLGVAAHETAFLDDLGVNVKAARKLGMHTIRVELNRSKEALWELERLLGVSLITDRPPVAVRSSL